MNLESIIQRSATAFAIGIGFGIYKDTRLGYLRELDRAIEDYTEKKIIKRRFKDLAADLYSTAASYFLNSIIHTGSGSSDIEDNIISLPFAFLGVKAGEYIHRVLKKQKRFTDEDKNILKEYVLEAKEQIIRGEKISRFSEIDNKLKNILSSKGNSSDHKEFVQMYAEALHYGAVYKTINDIWKSEPAIFTVSEVYNGFKDTAHILYTHENSLYDISMKVAIIGNTLNAEMPGAVVMADTKELEWNGTIDDITIKTLDMRSKDSCILYAKTNHSIDRMRAEQILSSYYVSKYISLNSEQITSKKNDTRKHYKGHK